MSEKEPVVTSSIDNEWPASIFPSILDNFRTFVTWILWRENNDGTWYTTEFLWETWPMSWEFKITAPNGWSTIVTVNSISALIKEIDGKNN